MIFNSGLPMRFWGDAVKYACYVLNRSPTKSNPKGMSPLQMLEGHAPSLKDIVIFGSPCTVYIKKKTTKTFKPRAAQGLILGRSEGTKGYQVYLVNEKTVTTTQHIKNIETLSASQNASILKDSGVTEVTAESDEADKETSPFLTASKAPKPAKVVQSAVQEEQETPKRVKTRSKEKRKPSQKVRENADQANNVSLVDPTTYDGAMKTCHAKK
jgi:hypothetical protein